MISSQSHPQGQDFADVTTGAAYNSDPNDAVEHQDYQQEQNNHRSTMMLHDMREQIEFYFSINNYPRDTFLQQMVATHQGSVPISVIAQFPKVQQLYHAMMQYYYANDPSFVAPIEFMVCRSLGPSRLVDVSNDGYYLRPNWMLLQDQDPSQSHIRHAGAFNNDSGHPQVVKPSAMNHTDATNTTVSPTSFASGSDGSVGPQSIGGDVVPNTKLHPQPLPVMFNPTGGVYYVPPQAYQYPGFPATTAYHHLHPSMGVVASSNVPHSYPVTASFYRPNLEPNAQYYMPQHQFMPPQPHPQYFNQPPPPPQQLLPNHRPTYLDAPTSDEPYSKVPSSGRLPEGGNQRSMPSPASLNAPPNVIRLQDPFQEDTIHSRNLNKGNRKKNKGGNNKNRLNRQSSDTSSQNKSVGRSGLPNGNETKRLAITSQQGQSQSTNEDTAVHYGADGEVSVLNTYMSIGDQSKIDDTNNDGSSCTGVSIPKKEKNRVSASHQNRTSTHRPQPPHRGIASSSQPSQNRHPDTTGTRRGGSKNRSNTNDKSEVSGTAAAAKKEANILIDENFPCLSKVANHDAIGKTENKTTLIEESNKKKYAEALLYNPGIPNLVPVSTQAAAVVAATSNGETESASDITGDVHTEIPAITNLLDKFNLHK